MSADNSSKITADKAHDAAERAKESVDSALHDAGQAIRGGVALFKDTVANTKDAVNEQLHRNAAEAERVRQEGNLSANERVVSVANEVKNDAQAHVDELKQDLRKP
jgi:hypothetical protein